jgi:Na+/melibiose symporter-like transporter
LHTISGFFSSINTISELETLPSENKKLQKCDYSKNYSKLIKNDTWIGILFSFLLVFVAFYCTIQFINLYCNNCRGAPKVCRVWALLERSKCATS